MTRRSRDGFGLECLTLLLGLSQRFEYEDVIWIHLYLNFAYEVMCKDFGIFGLILSVFM